MVLVLGTAAGIVAGGRADRAVAPVLVLATVLLFAASVTWSLVVGMGRRPRLRPALTALAIGVLLWLAGSIAVAVTETSGPVAFPAPGEVLFLAAYAAMAAFVFLDVQPTSDARAAVAWTDAAILVGGTGAIASSVVLMPVASSSADEGLSLLVALIYPLVTGLLMLLVIGQWALGLRPRGRRTAMLAAGFGVLAAADSTLLIGYQRGGYSFTLAADVLWGLGLSLVATAAVLPRARHSIAPRREVPGVLLLSGFVGALFFLIIRPDGAVGWVVSACAGLALAASALRLLMSLSRGREVPEAASPERDPLTGLYGRQPVLRRLDDDLANGRRFGVLVADVTHFQEINSALGPDAGDEVLRDLADLLLAAVPAGAQVARIGGDELAVVLGTDDETILEELAKDLRSSVAVRLEREGTRFTARIAIGVATARSGAASGAEILALAEEASLEATREPLRVHVGRERVQPAARRRLQLAEELHDAIRGGALDVWYQPIAMSATGAVDRVEALVRWDHPREGMISPALFLPMARRDNLMLDLSTVVAGRVLEDLADWHRQGLDVTVSLNLDAGEVLGGAFLPWLVQSTVHAGLAPQDLTIEVTEETFLDEPERARALLVEARRWGLRLSIDHYGSGFSSLAYLRELPVSEVKLDPAFFAAVCTDAKSAVIVQSTVTMAHALGLSVVAEGVETEEVASRAIVLGVDRLQGWFLSQPVPAGAVAMVVRQFAIARPAG